jgi:hypothetical protein
MWQGFFRGPVPGRHRALTRTLVFGTRQPDCSHTKDDVAARRWFTRPATRGIKPIDNLPRGIA